MSPGNRRVRLVFPDRPPAIPGRDCKPGTVYLGAASGDYYLCLRSKETESHRGFVYLGGESAWSPVDMGDDVFYEVGPLSLN